MMNLKCYGHQLDYYSINVGALNYKPPFRLLTLFLLLNFGRIPV